MDQATKAAIAAIEKQYDETLLAIMMASKHFLKKAVETANMDDAERCGSIAVALFKAANAGRFQEVEVEG